MGEGRVERVDSDDQVLPGRACPVAPKKFNKMRTCCDFAVEWNGIFEIEGDRVCLAGKRLVEQVRARAGPEQFAAHRLPLPGGPLLGRHPVLWEESISGVWTLVSSRNNGLKTENAWCQRSPSLFELGGE